MRRRRLLGLGLAAAAWVAASGHTPYRQWTVYRQRRLLIGTCRADAPTYPLGQRIAATLASYLPESAAGVSRAPDQWRLASLLSTGQLPVILLSRADAAALVAAEAPFIEFWGVQFAALFAFGDYLLVCRSDFPARHAYRVVRTLTEHAEEIPGARPIAAYEALPPHPGALAYARGQPPPPEPGSKP
ncbi:MAG: hypothetical protein OEM59_18885 [Rhodospirillales bacterium]|nr:hypothetical protein [Rhodospirillales bacterium]